MNPDPVAGTEENTPAPANTCGECGDALANCHCTACHRARAMRLAAGHVNPLHDPIGVAAAWERTAETLRRQLDQARAENARLRQQRDEARRDAESLKATNEAYWRAQKVLDEALGTEEDDGMGEGLAADVWLLAQQRDDALRKLASALPVLAPDTRVLLDDGSQWIVTSIGTVTPVRDPRWLSTPRRLVNLMPAPEAPVPAPSATVSPESAPVNAPSTTTPEPSETATEGARGKTVKMIRERLCREQFAATSDETRRVLQGVIDLCDVLRPLGVNGKHGDRHTSLCGCEDVRELDPRVVVGDQVIGEAAADDEGPDQSLQMLVDDVDRLDKHNAALRLELATMTRDRDEARGETERVRDGILVLLQDVIAVQGLVAEVVDRPTRVGDQHRAYGRLTRIADGLRALLGADPTPEATT